MTAADIPDDAIAAALPVLNDIWGEEEDWTSEECVAHILAAALPALRRHDADKLASWEATAAELRRQLTGTNALLATAKAKAERLHIELQARNLAYRLCHQKHEALKVQRQAILDLCDDPLPRHWRDTAVVPIADVLDALGVSPA